MGLDEEKQENLLFMSDFLLRIAMIAGNATLDTKEAYLVSVKNQCDQYIYYYTNGGQIQSALHYGGSNIFHRFLSEQKIESIGARKTIRNIEYNYTEGKKAILFTNDNYPWEAISALPLDFRKRVDMSRDDIMRISIDEKQIELASELARGGYDISYNRKPERNSESERKIAKLKGFVSDISAVAGEVGVNIIDGEYYISIPTRDGKFMIYHATDLRLESEEGCIFRVIKSSRNIEPKTPPKGVEDIFNIRDEGNAEVLYDRATAEDIKKEFRI